MYQINVFIFLSMQSNSKLYYFCQRFSYRFEVGARGLLNLVKYSLTHRNWETRLRLKQQDFHFKLIKKHKYQCNCLTFIIYTPEYLHQCVNVNICNFVVLGPIFMKFAPICRAEELGMLWTIFGKLMLIFRLGRGPC